MWYLTSDNDNRIIYIVSSTEVVIGRSVDAQVCNFAIADDPSISRKHVTLKVVGNNLVIQDLESRYGTFVNDWTTKIESNIDIKLNNNDVVKFGKMNSVWKLHTVNHVTCASTLKGANLQKLKSLLSAIGGIFKSDWDDSCTFLTMPAITLTIKVVLALVHGSHIVTTEFWVKCVEAVNNFAPLPDPKDFTPNVVESTLNKEVVSFLPNFQRKTLFSGKKFVFFAKRQFEMYKTVLMKSSATPMLISESKMTVSTLCEDDVIVIQYIPTGQDTQVQTNQINDIVNLLKSKEKRVVADAEIGLAILYCSTQKYCNPNFSFTSEVVKQAPHQNNNTANVLAQETQHTNTVDGRKENVIINESLVSDDKKNILDNIENISSKRKLADLQELPNKKFATTCSVANIPNEANKRKLSNEDDKLHLSKKQALGQDQNEDDLFKFITEDSNANDQSKNKKLNLSRPQKRKADTDNNDGLFGFVQPDNDDKSPAELTKRSLFSIDKIKQEESSYTVNKVEVTAEDIVAMRGVKLKELKESTLSYNSTLDYKVKKENCDELADKMSDLDLGCTIVITCNDLIVKKEPIPLEGHHDTTVKNFKKFKKVWPLKKQVTVIPSSAMSIAT